MRISDWSSDVCSSDLRTTESRPSDAGADASLVGGGCTSGYRLMMSAMDPPLHERVYEGLKEDYLAGHFVPGKKIYIQDLATSNRSSKTLVREAAFIKIGIASCRERVSQYV